MSPQTPLDAAQGCPVLLRRTDKPRFKSFIVQSSTSRLFICNVTLQDENSSPQTPLDAARKGVQFYEMLQCEDGHWAGDYGGPHFLAPGMVICVGFSPLVLHVWVFYVCVRLRILNRCICCLCSGYYRGLHFIHPGFKLYTLMYSHIHKHTHAAVVCDWPARFFPGR